MTFTKNISILGFPIARLSKREALALIGDWVSTGGSARHLATVNPEFLVRARRDPAFAQVLQEADLRVADGVGILAAAQFLFRLRHLRVKGVARTLLSLVYGLYCGFCVIAYRRGLSVIPETSAGVDLVDDLCRLAAREGWQIFILGGRRGVAESSAQVLKQRYPGLRAASSSGSAQAAQETDEEWKQVLTWLNQGRPEVLLAGYGTPAQEFWINRHQGQLPCRLAVGVGGALDMIAGRLPRAPRWCRRLGLEWAWRLWLQPSRIGRIINAAVKFPYLVWKEGIRS